MIVMVLILVALIASLYAAIKMLDFDGMAVNLLGAGLLMACAITGISYCYMAWNWFASEHKAAIINREYGTNYTKEEVFFASDVIDTVRELDRKRVEINGNIITGKEHEE